MDNARWTRIQELFLAVRELADIERAAYLDRQCGDDAELRCEVCSLLQADPGSGAVDQLADRWLAPVADQPDPPSLLGEQVGPYRICGDLGRGGMARVYLAQRDDGQFQQQVAVKVLQRGHGDLVRRFEHERRILARLTHPNIAGLMDGGTLPDGTPYLVMEYVDGRRIDRWVDERDLSVRDTVVLFLQVCEAVQFAHSNLVVHRDIKPSNILVTPAGHVRLLDFGIAKLLADDAPELTRPFTMVLTPEYASPEQVIGEPVTTATDVYALGLVLYRLLGGRVAQPGEGRTDGEMRHQVREVQPPPPSLIAPSTKRARALRGDLDTMVARALAKDPQRRYGTPQALGDDLRRWLDGHPVQARPDGTAYRVQKFVQRHRAPVVAALLAVLALIVGLGGTLWQAGAATRQRDLARQEAVRSEQVTRLMVDLFEAADPLLAAGDTLTARQLLDRGRRRVDQELSDQPRVRADMLHAMGNAYLNLGLHDRADTLLHRSHRLLAAATPVDSMRLTAALGSLGRLAQARGRYRDACDRFSEVLARRRRLGAEPAQLATAWNNLGSAFMSLGRPDSAMVSFREALRLRETQSRPAPLDLAQLLGNLAQASNRLGDAEAAEDLFARADSVMVATAAENAPQRADLLSSWGVMRYGQGDHAGAAERVVEALGIWRRTLGEDHPQVGRGENNLAAILERQGRDEDAEFHYLESLRIKREVLGSRHPSVASTLNNLALLVQRRGDFARSEALLQESLSIREETLPADHPQIARAWYNLARLYHDTERPDRAEALYRRALDLRSRVLGDDHRETRWVAQSLAGLLRDGDRIDEAAALEARYGLSLEDGS